MDLRRSTLLPIALAAGLFAAASAVGQAEGSSQAYVIPSVPYSVQAVTPPGAATMAGQDVMLTATTGTDLFTSPEGASAVDNAPRLLFQPVGDFILAAQVSGAFSTSYDGGALIVYADKATWGKLLFEEIPAGGTAISTTVTKGTGDDALHQLIGAQSVHLKITRTGAQYVFHTSEDGVAWRMVRAFTLPGTASPLIGLSAQSPLGKRRAF